MERSNSTMRSSSAMPESPGMKRLVSATCGCRSEHEFEANFGAREAVQFEVEASFHRLQRPDEHRLCHPVIVLRGFR